MLPVKAQVGRLQADNSKIHTIAGSGEASGKIKLHIRRGLRSRYGRSEHFQPDFRLAQGCSDVGFRPPGPNRFGIAREVQIVGIPNIAERVHEYDPVQSGAIFRGRLNFGLILLVDL